MMNWIWKEVEKLINSKTFKVKLFLLLNTMFFSFIGLLVWGILYQFFMVDWTWGICLVGYPGFFVGYIGGALYLMNHH